MDRVNVALVALKVVAVHVRLGAGPALVGRREELVVGEEGRLAGAEVGQDHAAGLAAWVRGVADAFVEGPALSLPKDAAGRLAGLLQAAAADVVEPAVVDAPQPPPASNRP